MLNYNHLYYFHVTASEGSVAKAAERLGVGQPTVSEQVRQLERSLGTPLFERVSGKLRLTEPGRHAFEHTSIMFRAGERLVEGLAGAKTPPPLTLRVGVSATVGRTVATDFLMPLLALEDCVPTIRSGESHELLRELRSHDLDLLVCESDPGPAHRTELELVPIHQVRLVAITRAKQPPQERWEDVALVHYRPISVYRAAVDNYLDDHNLHPRIAAETDDALVMMAAVMRGGFAAFVPASVAKDSIAAGTVKVIAELEPEHASVNALYHDVESSHVARRAVELLVEHAKRVDG